MKKVLFFILTLFVLSACASKVKTSKAHFNCNLTEADGTRAATIYPGASLETLQKGKSLYEENCSKCHSLKSTADYNAEQWGKHVKRMAPKAKIDAPTESLILQYVVTMCGK